MLNSKPAQFVCLQFITGQVAVMRVMRVSKMLKPKRQIRLIEWVDYSLWVCHHVQQLSHYTLAHCSRQHFWLMLLVNATSVSIHMVLVCRVLCSQQVKHLTIVFTNISNSSGILYNFLQEEIANILYVSKHGVLDTRIRLRQRGSRPMAEVLRKGDLTFICLKTFVSLSGGQAGLQWSQRGWEVHQSEWLGFILFEQKDAEAWLNYPLNKMKDKWPSCAPFCMCSTFIVWILSTWWTWELVFWVEKQLFCLITRPRTRRGGRAGDSRE